VYGVTRRPALRGGAGEVGTVRPKARWLSDSGTQRAAVVEMKRDVFCLKRVIFNMQSGTELVTVKAECPVLSPCAFSFGNN
jgi:hypothetical protein